MSSDKINGYEQEYMTHFEVAAAVAEGRAEVGFGLETAAHSYGLDFIYLVRERYDLVIPGVEMGKTAFTRLADWLKSEEAAQAIATFRGYDIEETGNIQWINS
jgi:molybdate-binding protein